MSYTGRTIGNYEIIDLIGAGGMGEVYRAKDAGLDREVAIKFLPASVSKDANRLARFEQEARAAGALNHPNLVTIFELGTEDGAPFIVMELVDGQSLRQILGDTTSAGSSGTSGSLHSSAGSGREPGRTEGDDSGGAGSGDTGATNTSFTTPPSGTIAIPMRKAIEYAAQMAHGLAAAHDKNIVHRDLKPDNVLIARDGRAKILDFGLAKLTAPGAAGEDSATMAIQGAETTPGAVMGTVGYMSPEQVRGEVVDHRADIFALGVILYEMLSGRRAFHSSTSVQTMHAILTEDPPALTGDKGSGSGLNIPPLLDRIVRRCLEKNPAERFQSGHDLAYALEATVDASVTMAGAAITDGMAPASPGSTPRVPIITAVLLAALAAGVGWFLAPRADSGGSATASGSHQGKWSQPRFFPLTFEEGLEVMPALAPDGNSFVYVATTDSVSSDIYFRRVGGGVSLNLTGTPSLNERDPAFSPDGSQIAYAVTGSNGEDGVYVMGATGESRRKVIDRGGNPTWSPDGAQLAIATHSVNSPQGRPSTSEVWIVDVASGELIRKIFEGDAVQPDWSADGKWIAFWGLPAGTGNRTLYTVPAEGGEANVLNEDAYINWCPRWSDDGRSLYFASDRGGTMDIWRVGIDPKSGKATGTPEAITRGTVSFAPFDLGGSNERIIGSATEQSFQLMTAAVDVEKLSIGKPVPLFSTGRNIWQVRVSPDGEWLALKANDPSEDLFICKQDGTDFRRLTNDPYKDRGQVWAPDSKTIYFFSDRDGKYRIWRIQRDGGGLKQVTNVEGEVTCGVPNLSFDGKYMSVFLVGSDKSAWFALTDDLPLTELSAFPPLPGGGVFFAMQFSPSDYRLAGLRNGEVDGAGELVIYDMDSGEYDLTGVQGPGTWIGDNELMINADGAIDVFDLRTRERTPLQGDHSLSSIGRGSISFRTGKAFYVSTSSESDIWMVEAGEPEPFAAPAER